MKEFNKQINELKKSVDKKNIKKNDKPKYKWEPLWLSLDNAATIYPSIREENWDFVFRVSALLKEKINMAVLQSAVDDIMPRFPSFNVKLKNGIFWNYFERHDKNLEVQQESEFPCSRFKRDASKHIVRVLYYGNRLSVECFHAVADGRSVLKFLNSLLKRYFELLGIKICSEEGLLNFKDKPRREELSDAFFEYADNSGKLKHKEKTAYFIPGTQEEYGVINSVIAEMSVEEVKQIAKKHNAKLFEFLVACLGVSIMKRVKQGTKKPIKISVPIDLRRFFESETLRNFSGYLNVEFPINKNLTLEEAISIVKTQFAEITKERMQGFINSNVAMQKNYIIKLVPLCVKNFFINLFFKKWGESYQTLAMSNLGVVQVPEEFSSLIDFYEFNVGRPKYNAKSIGVVSFNDKLTLTFSSKIKENTTEQDFFTMLTKLGVNIKLYSNRRDLYA